VVEFKRHCDYSIRFIADNMRAADEAEVWAAGLHSPFDSIMGGVDVSDFTTVVWIDGVPCTIFGLVKRSLITGAGTPWMLSAEQVMGHRREIVRHSPPVIDQMLDLCPRLMNYVHSKNTLSIRWLRWLGFTIDSAIPYGDAGEFFHKFHCER